MAEMRSSERLSVSGFALVCRFAPSSLRSDLAVASRPYRDERIWVELWSSSTPSGLPFPHPYERKVNGVDSPPHTGATP